MNDFKLDAQGDLDFSSGDLQIIESTLQHQADIIWADKGWYKHAPTLGVGLQSYLNESGTAPGLMRAIRSELERDGMKVSSVSLSNNAIDIDATYE